MTRRTNWDRVDELNSILGDHPKYFFSLIKNARDCTYPYALCLKPTGAISRSLPFKEMKEIANLIKLNQYD